jgi:predicted metalloprotease
LLFSRSDLKDLLIAIKNKINKKNESSVNGLPIEGIPSDFDPDVYLLLNPDVSKANMDPYFHYTNHGKFEGRRFK